MIFKSEVYNPLHESICQCEIEYEVESRAAVFSRKRSFYPIIKRVVTVEGGENIVSLLNFDDFNSLKDQAMEDWRDKLDFYSHDD